MHFFSLSLSLNKHQLSRLSKLSFTVLVITLPFLSYSQFQSAYPLFDTWPIVKLEQSKLVCDDYQTTFLDEFNGTQIDPSKWYTNLGTASSPNFHCASKANFFTSDNVSVNNGMLDLTIKWNETPQVLQHPFDCCDWEENYCNSTDMSRNITSGCVSTTDFFNLGRYEARIKFSDNEKVWNSFWMWHHDEIDITDFGIPSYYFSATHSGGVSSLAADGPCCTSFVDCDFCEANSIDCSASPDCDCKGWILDCHYLPDDFHVIGCEWTPFRVSFYIDGITTATVYRYYKLDKTPLIIECGDEIPAIYVRENPSFPYITPDVNNPTVKTPSDIGFRPTLWIATLPLDEENNCTLENCPAWILAENLPASCLVDYVKVETRTYENVSIVPDCYQLCTSTTPVCVDLQTFRYNSTYGNPQFAEATVKPLAPPLNWDWQLSSLNTINITQRTSKELCFDNTGSSDVTITANITHPFGGQDFELTKVLAAPEPEVFLQPVGTGWAICIHPNGYCGDYSYSIGNQTFTVNSAAGIQCLDDCECSSSITVNWLECGVLTSYVVNPPVSCSITAPDVIIEEGTDVVWSSCRNLKGNVLVESGGKLTITCDVGLPEDARITVQQNGELIIDGARIYNNCDGDYWEGIIVEGQSGKPQYYDNVNGVRYVGYLKIKNGAIIEKAKVGVRAQDPFHKNKTGGVIEAYDATFLNCMRQCVDIRDYQNSTFSEDKRDNLSYFKQCSFLLDESYTGSFSSQFLEMVYLKNVNGIRFSGCDFINGYPFTQSYADDRKTGIYAVGAGFKVDAACTADPEPVNCLPTRRSHFEGFNKAINTGGTLYPNSLRVTRTDFYDNCIGIYAIS